MGARPPSPLAAHSPILLLTFTHTPFPTGEPPAEGGGALRRSSRLQERAAAEAATAAEAAAVAEAAAAAEAAGMDALAAAAAVASPFSSGGDAPSSGGDAPSSGATAAALFADYTGDGGAMEAFLRSLEPVQLAALLVHLGAKTRKESEELLRGAGGQGGDLVAAAQAALVAGAPAAAAAPAPAASAAPLGAAMPAAGAGARPTPAEALTRGAQALAAFVEWSNRTIPDSLRHIEALQASRARAEAAQDEFDRRVATSTYAEFMEWIRGGGRFRALPTRRLAATTEPWTTAPPTRRQRARPSPRPRPRPPTATATRSTPRAATAAKR